MNSRFLVSAFVIGTLFSASAFAQSLATETQRNINQQTRIEQGLKSGELSTREAARLEHEQARVNRMQAGALRDGQLSGAERKRIDRAQDHASRDIYRQKHDAGKGNPESASSQRMQQDVQRDIQQQKRINEGVRSGELTAHEAGRLERGQSRSAAAQARAGADGHVGAREQAGVQHRQDRQSVRILRQKHDAQHGG